MRYFLNPDPDLEKPGPENPGPWNNLFLKNFDPETKMDAEKIWNEYEIKKYISL